jgi:hypothetical protein
MMHVDIRVALRSVLLSGREIGQCWRESWTSILGA